MSLLVFLSLPCDIRVIHICQNQQSRAISFTNTRDVSGHGQRDPERPCNQKNYQYGSGKSFSFYVIGMINQEHVSYFYYL